MLEEGKKLGLIDSLVASEELLRVSWQWALDIANMHKPWVRSLHRTDKIGSLSEARNLINIARQQARNTAPICLSIRSALIRLRWALFKEDIVEFYTYFWFWEILLYMCKLNLPSK